MGYETTYAGELSIAPPWKLPAELPALLTHLNENLDALHQSCVITAGELEGVNVMGWGRYYEVDFLTDLEAFLALLTQHGRQVNGEIEAEADVDESHTRYVVTENKVRAYEGRVVFEDDPLYRAVDEQIERFRSTIEEDTEINGSDAVGVLIGFLRELAEIRGRPYYEEDLLEDGI